MTCAEAGSVSGALSSLGVVFLDTGAVSEEPTRTPDDATDTVSNEGDLEI